ncbi:MAG: DUF4433 domain-containing protein [Bacteroidia bacterium]|jgi:hypothetical protein|nr:DUF4433 domain-containing protein [Bacteroidia bacterium]
MKQLFRITHLNNLPFILINGLHCPNSTVQDPDFVPIGFPSLIDYRKDRIVPISPGGTLSAYIPFYFWYRSPMLYVIHKGNDPEVIQTPQEEIIYLVTDMEKLNRLGCQYIFTDRHAKLDYTKFYNNSDDLEKLNWEFIKTDQWGRQFGAERMEMKQAECLVYRYIPTEALLGIAVLNEKVYDIVIQRLKGNEIEIPVKIRPNFYF